MWFILVIAILSIPFLLPFFLKHFLLSLLFSFGGADKKRDLSSLKRTETITEEDVKPHGTQIDDDNIKTKAPINERVQACDEFLKELQLLDQASNEEFEKSLNKDHITGGK